MRPSILIRGAHAYLTGVNGDTVEECLEDRLTALMPGHEYAPSFQSGHWDGYVRLYRNRRFPAGATNRVRKWFLARGAKPTIETCDNPHPSAKVVGKNYLPERGRFKGLWPHQLEAIHTMIKHDRGISQVPTGGGKTECMVAVAKFFHNTLGWKTLIVTSRRGLARQTAERFRTYLGDKLRIGQCGDGKRETEDCDVVCATAATLMQFRSHKTRRGKRVHGKASRMAPGDPRLAKVLNTFMVLILDECHHSASSSWYDIAMASKAKRRYGMSGTPLRSSKLNDLRVIGATGPIIYRMRTQTLISAGLAARPLIAMVMSPNASGPRLPRTVTRTGVWEMPYADAYEMGIANNRHHNAAVIRAVQWIHDKGRQILILCRRKTQWTTLCALLEATGIRYHAVWGATTTDERTYAKRMMRERKLPVVLASTVWDEGEDLYSVDALVLAEGVQVKTSVLQRIGRGMREGNRDLWVVDFAPTNHATLLKHSVRRAVAYEKEGHPVYLVENWPPLDAFDFDEWPHLLPFSCAVDNGKSS
jgi:superfamily II DNA or RNA helicase